MNLLGWIARFALELGVAADETLALDDRAAALARVSERIAELRSWLAGELVAPRACGFLVEDLRGLAAQLEDLERHRVIVARIVEDDLRRRGLRAADRRALS